METLDSKDKYIFFLKLNENLPVFYFNLATLFSELGFTLVPIEAESLKEISYLEKKFVLAIRHDIESQLNFYSKKMNFIEYLLKQFKITLMDVSSFGKIPIVKKYRLHKCYRHFPLPMDIEDIVMRMAYLYYSDKTTKQVWPGGKRGKFPEMPGN